MGTNIITDLDSQLASLNQLKPPGASKGKITSITQLCVSNIQAEQNIVQSLYRALKKAPATHKLGAVYVVDSVVRRWIEQAKQSGQDLNIEGRGEPGTYAAAVKRITELMPALFDDTFKSIPAEQKEKLEGMIKIWDKGNTFPTKMLQEFKAKMSGENNKTAVQTNGNMGAMKKMTISEKFSAPVPSRPTGTPIGYPPQYLYDQGLLPRKADQAKQTGMGGSSVLSPQVPQHTPQQQPAAPQPPQDVNSILAALANLPKPTPQQQPAFVTVPQPPAPQQQVLPPQIPPNIAALFAQQNGFGGMQAPPPQPQAPSYQQPPPQQQFQLPPGFPAYPPQPPPSVPQHYAQAPPPPQAAPMLPPADVLAPLRGIVPPRILNDPQKVVEALHLLQDLQREGVPMDKWAPVLQALDEKHQPPVISGYEQYGGGRARSRSPERGGGRRRASPVYGNYEDPAARKQGNDDRGRAGKNRYRERTPLRDSPGLRDVAMNGMPMRPKFVGHDPNLPSGCIKVLSRTLFVGGATGSQQEITTLFSRFGHVQTIIANRNKRHAFVKMSTREEALLAKKSLEDLQNANEKDVVNVARQTKWGVGFGPRECCDYVKGESTIPIHKLTDADMKWMLTAEYGGTGGLKVEAGMVVEEPDIEIGAGVSSKAMSKRVLPDTGPPAKRQHREDGGQRNGGGRDKDRDRNKRQNDGYGAGMAAEQRQPPPMPMQYGYQTLTPAQVAAPPPVPGFSFTLPGPQGGYR